MHLFAGAGGGLLADLILGHEPIVAVEWDKYACQVLRERAADGWFPGLHVYEGDVRLFDPSEYAGRVGSIAAGFPCQDISIAGKGEGITGERSGLVSEVFRAIDAVRPRFVFLENSPQIRTRGRHVVIGELVARGYAWRDGIIGASDVGAPHRRSRWFCLAERANTDGLRELQPQGSKQNQRGRVGDLCEDVADAVRQRQRQQRVIASGPDAERWTEQGERQDRSCGDGIGWRATESGVCGMADGMAYGLDRGWWEVEPDVGRTIIECADRGKRIKSLGNGQVSLQAAVAWCLLRGQYERNSQNCP